MKVCGKKSLKLWQWQLEMRAEELYFIFINKRIIYLLYLFTYSLNPWSRVLLEKLTGSWLVKKFPAFYGTRKFITAFTCARHPSLPSASSILSIPPHPTSWRSILILSSHLRLGLPSGLFPSVLPAHLILLDFITRTIFGEEYRSLSSSLCSFLHSPVTSSLLGPNILLNTLFSNNLSLRYSLNVNDQVSHPYKATGNIIVLYILNIKLLICGNKNSN